MTTGKCYFLQKVQTSISWYEAREICSLRQMDLVTLASDQELLDFLQIIHNYTKTSVYLGATINSPEGINVGNAERAKWYFNYMKSEKITKALYISDVYGIKTLWWNDGRPGLTIQSHSSFKKSACLKFSPNRSKDTSLKQHSVSSFGTNFKPIMNAKSISSIIDNTNTKNNTLKEYSLSFVNCQEKIHVSSVCERQIKITPKMITSKDDSNQLKNGNKNTSKFFKNISVKDAKGSYYVINYIQLKSKYSIRPKLLFKKYVFIIFKIYKVSLKISVSLAKIVFSII